MSKEWSDLIDTDVRDAIQDPLITNLGGHPKKKKGPDALTRLIVKDAGFEFAGSLDGMVSALFFHCTAYQGYQGFGQPLPHGLTFSDSRKTARKKLGKPDIVEEAIAGVEPPRDCWDFDAYRLAAEYSDDQRSIVSVCLQSLANKKTGRSMLRPENKRPNSR